MKPRYKRMLEGMRKKAKKSIKRRGSKWFVYILNCCDRSLYTGITKDIKRRFKMHSKGKGARYTRTRLPLKLVYQERCRSRTEALMRECAVKALPRLKKMALVERFKQKASCQNLAIQLKQT